MEKKRASILRMFEDDGQRKPQEVQDKSARQSVDVLELSRRHAALLDLRSPWDTAWRDLSSHFLPTRFRDVGQNGDSVRNPKLLNDKLVDSTGVLAMRTLAAGLQGGMTSPARPWFRLTLEDEELSQAHGVRQWMDEVANRMRTVLHRSNFYNAVHTMYAELGAFGTAFMMEVADFRHGFRFIPFTAGEFCLDTNERQQVDVVFRKFQMTARQLVRRFGEGCVPDYIKDHAKKHDTRQSEQYTVVHAVYPRNDRNPRKWGGENMPWASVYWLEFGGAYGGSYSTNAKPHVLSESGFDEFPGFGPRWDVTGNDVYGKSPAMDVLPDCRMLQQMGITTLKAIHKAIDPPMSVSASLKSVGLDLTPAGINYVENQPGAAPQAATPILQVRPEIQAARMTIQDVQRQIQEGLYNDLFRMLLGSNRAQITAREVAAREEEKLILVGPVLERLQNELHMPLIDRTFSLMERLDMLPPPPPELAGAPIKVEFVSLLAQAQKMVSTSAVDQFLGFAMNAAQAFPEVLDAVDVDKVVDNYAEYLGVEADMVRPLQDRDQMRQQRAEAQAAAQTAETGSGSLLSGNAAGAGGGEQDKLGEKEGQEGQDDNKQAEPPFTLEDLAVPEGFSARPEDIQRFHETALGMGLTKDQAQQLVDMQHANVVAAQQHYSEQVQRWAEEVRMDKEMGGPAFESTIMYANAALTKVDPEGELRELLESGGYANNPTVIRALSRMGKVMGEDVAVTGKGGGDESPLWNRLYPASNK